jgi:DNA polymerase-3 subunit delta'
VPLGSVLGQERAIGLLQSAMKSGRVHHAWIFFGPEGVGKFTTAMAWAGVLLDPTSRERAPGSIEPDPDSPVQTLWRRRAHPDLHVVRKELAAVSRDPAVRAGKQVSIPREVVAEFLIEPAARTRLMANDSTIGKVFIVDEAELLNDASQTILLKTIEEPPAGTLIILVTSREHELRATIRSRCQRVAFAPLSDEAMRRWLEDAGPALPEEDRDFLLRFAAGSPGVLRTALEGGLAEWQRSLGPMLDAAMEGRFVAELGPAMAERVEKYASAWVEARPGASKEAANRLAAGWMFRLAASRLREALDRGADARMFARAVDALAGAERHLDANVPLLFVFEWLSAELSSAFAGAVTPRN